MKIVTKENLDSFKSSDLVCLECYNCGKEFEKQKKYILDEIKFKRGNNKYCSWKCFNESKNKKLEFKCGNCEKKILRTQSEFKKNKSGNFFCNSSCSASYNNKKMKNETKNKISTTLKNKTIEEKIITKNKREFALIDKYGSLEKAYEKMSPKHDELTVNKIRISLKKYWDENPKKKEEYSIVAKKRVVSKETRKKLSDNMQKIIKDGKHKGWTSRNNPSYPEKFFMTVLKNNNIEYEFENPCGKYFIDFALKDKKIALEIDGKQHNRKEKDEEKNIFLKSQNWFVYRIKWNNINSLSGKEEMKEKIDNFVKFYNDF